MKRSLIPIVLGIIMLFQVVCVQRRVLVLDNISVRRLHNERASHVKEKLCRQIYSIGPYKNRDVFSGNPWTINGSSLQASDQGVTEVCILR